MCPAGFTEKGDYCFKLETERKTWQQAVDACQEINSYLIEPRTEEINNIAKSFDLGNNTWFGASDIKFEENWVWESDGERLTFKDWEPGQPNNHNNQDCASFQQRRWVDRNCDATGKFICQTEKRKYLFLH